MELFRKKPLTVEAYQVTSKYQEILTPHGKAVAEVGDWVVVDVDGRAYPVRDSVFRKTYSPLDHDGAIISTWKAYDKETDSLGEVEKDPIVFSDAPYKSLTVGFDDNGGIISVEIERMGSLPSH